MTNWPALRGAGPPGLTTYHDPKPSAVCSTNGGYYERSDSDHRAHS